jgi:hypothetical protein
MRITERQLRKFIRDVIQEARAVEDESFLNIGGRFYKSAEDYYDTFEKKHFRSKAEQTNEKVMQLFKVWCNKNNLDGMDAQGIVDFFYEDYPHLVKTSSEVFKDELLSYAEKMSIYLKTFM